MNWKHFLGFLVTIGITQWDVFSDLKNGVSYLQSRNVSRTYDPAWYPDGVPSYCLLDSEDQDNNDTKMHLDHGDQDNNNTKMLLDPVDQVNNDTKMLLVPGDQDTNDTKMVCTERDPVWGAASIALVQAPMWLGGGILMAGVLVMHFLSALENCCGETGAFLFVLAALLLLQIVPYPLMILSVQLLYLIKPNYKLRNIGLDLLDVVMILVSFEAGGEAGPQALLQLYIALSDWEKGFSPILIMTLLSSILTIAKASIPAFSSRHIDEKSLSDGDPSSVVAFYTSTLRFLPLFATSIVFRVTSATITLVLFKRWAFLPLSLGSVAITTLSIILNKEQDDKVAKTIGSLLHGFGGVAVLTKSFFDNRNQTKIPMMISSCTWLVIHTISFLVIIIMISIPQLHLQHWKNTARIPLLAEDSVHILYIIIGCLILTGIVNTALVFYQVYNEDWDQVNKDVETRMRWRRGEVAGGMKETGLLEPTIRTLEGKLLQCWNCVRCKQTKHKNEDPKKLGDGPENVELIEANENNDKATAQGLEFLSVAENGEFPSNAFPLKLYSGETFFIGRAVHEGLRVPGYVDTNIPGYTNEIGEDVDPSVGCVTSWEFEGRTTKRYEVLVQEPGQHNLYWLDASKGRLEDLEAAEVGTSAEGGPLYVARAEVHGVWRAGKINPRYNGAFIGYLGEDHNGRKVWMEMMVEDYQVLCCKKMQ